ncbi:hypothetical protein MLD38_030504 [Melastoma candidum]|uniref:Uncharacterized protein n=1 Tax=Melastoma candidum TaxID=119954 RepID=A0ACB9MLD7_9MYRT|nr:hypothetical protein MLD38_030504 [Melastoma candidum]
MENQSNSDGPTPRDAAGTLVNSFVELTSSSHEEALFFLESHNFDLDAAVSTFFDNAAAIAVDPIPNNPVHDPNPTAPSPNSPPSQSPSQSQSYSPSPSLSRSRSPSPVRPAARAPYELRSRRSSGKKVDKGSGSSSRGIRTLADLGKDAGGDDSESDDSDEGVDYYTGGEKSGMLVRDPTRRNDVESIFEKARQSGAVERPAVQRSSRSKSFAGKSRLLSGEAVESAPQPPEPVTHIITFWQNGFTVNDGPLRRLDDPANARFLESIKNSESPEELAPADRRTVVNIDLVRRDEVYSEPKRHQPAFQGTARTLGSGDAAASSMATPQSAGIPASSGSSIRTAPFMGLVVDDSLPTTSIQLRLADGTRMVSRFNYSHTIRDIRAFIDASRPGGTRDYQLQAMGFPPKQLSDMDQTIEQAGIANSVVIQKL